VWVGARYHPDMKNHRVDGCRALYPGRAKRWQGRTDEPHGRRAGKAQRRSGRYGHRIR
jgi:hypothetical protein